MKRTDMGDRISPEEKIALFMKVAEMYGSEVREHANAGFLRHWIRWIDALEDEMVGESDVENKMPYYLYSWWRRAVHEELKASGCCRCGPRWFYRLDYFNEQDAAAAIGRSFPDFARSLVLCYPESLGETIHMPATDVVIHDSALHCLAVDGLARVLHTCMRPA